MKKIIIAIDGFSSTGKSTIAKQLAKRLGYVYVDTGAMYRAVALFAMEKGYINKEFFDMQALINDLPAIRLQFKYNEVLAFAEMFLNDENVENTIRTLEVSQYVSRIAEISEVRAKLVEQQQKMGQERGIVMDGRDIGTVVFPDAEVKIFMNSSAETRAKRRFEELIEKGQNVSYQDVLKNVQERDYIDSNREDSPLIIAKDAIEIDNSKLDKDQQFEQVLKLVQPAF
jgi:cytidylate kinase